MLGDASPQWIAAAASVFAAGLVRGFSGFGGALVMAPLLSRVFAPPQAVATIMLIELAGFVQMLPGAVRHIRWREIGPMVFVAALAIPFGVWLIVTVEPAAMRRIIGAVVVALALLLMLGHRLRVRPGLPTALGVSALSGLLEGLAGTPGPPVVVYFYAGPDSAAANRYNLIGYFACIDALGVALFALEGVVTLPVLGGALLLIPLSFAGTLLGGRLFRHAPDAVLRRIALGLILLVGVSGLVH